MNCLFFQASLDAVFPVLMRRFGFKKNSISKTFSYDFKSALNLINLKVKGGTKV